MLLQLQTLKQIMEKQVKTEKEVITFCKIPAIKHYKILFLFAKQYLCNRGFAKVLL